MRKDDIPYYKSYGLFLSFLSEKERRFFLEKGYIKVFGTNGYTYYFDPDGGVYSYDKRKRKSYGYCIDPETRIVRWDTIIALKILVESDAMQFERIANAWFREYRAPRLAQFASYIPQLEMAYKHYRDYIENEGE